MSDTPYVGPRPFRPGEKLFGRDREIRTLYYKLCADRVVLLHSPSGAGKSSLINAGLLPRMKKEFDIWGPARVYLPPPGGFSAGINPFVASVAGQESLTQYFGSLRAASKKNLLLVFDQFEEIITKEPVNRPAKEEFFHQLGEVLHDPGIWALFAMREDYLASLAPYVENLPSHLLNRFRIDLLGKEAALLAMQEPAQAAGRPFTPGALANLSRELCQIQAPAPDGKIEWVEGDYIEPLQLQVVCFELWRETSAPKADGSPYTEIDEQVLSRFGNVTDALAKYYTSSVESIADGDLAVERALRDWVEKNLISPEPERIRIQVQRRVPQCEGLDTRLIEDGLVARHLVRPETRGAATYFELSHDRLIRPVVKSNAEWRARRLHKVQVQADYWNTHERRDDLLLQAVEYPAAQEWADSQSALTREEELFLSKSRQRWMEEKIRTEEEERHQQKLRRAFYRSLVGLAAAVVLGIFGWGKMIEAEVSRRDSEQAKAEAERNIRLTRWNKVLLESQRYDANELKYRANLAYDEIADQERVQTSYRLGGSVRSNILPRSTQFDLAALLSLEAYRAADTYEARNAVLSTVQANPRLRTYFHHPAALRGLALSPDGRLLATAAADGWVRVWDTASWKLVSQIKAHANVATRVAFISGGEMLASAGADGKVRLWDPRPRTPAPLATLGSESTASVTALAWNEAKRLLAAGRQDGMVELYRVTDPAGAVLLGKPLPADRRRDVWRPGIFDLAFHPSGSILATSGPSEQVQFWQMDDPANPRRLIRVPSANFDTQSLAFDARGERLALAGSSHVELWNVQNPASPVRQARTSTAYGLASSVAFLPGRAILAVGYEKEWITLYDISQAGRVPREVVLTPSGSLNGHAGDVPALAGSPDGKLLYSAGDDREAISWWVDDPGQALRAEAPVVRGKGALAVQALPGGWLLAAGAPGLAQLWEIRGAQTRLLNSLPARGGGLTSLAFFRDGTLLAGGSWETDQPAVWDLRRRHDPRRIEITGPRVEDPHVAFHPARKLLAAGGRREGGALSSLVLYDLSGGQPRLLPNPPLNPVPEVTHIRSLAFSHNGRLLAAGYDTNGLVAVWDVSNPAQSRVLATLRGHSGVVTSLAFHPKGYVMATGGDDRNVVLWDISNPRAIDQHSILRGHGDWVWSLAFSPNGDNLAAGVRNGRTMVWDVFSGLLLGDSFQQEGEVFGVAFSPDGKTVASHSDRDGLRFWNLDPQSMQDRLCQLANRNLTAAEWQQYVGDLDSYQRTCPQFPEGAGVSEKKRK